MNKIVKNIIIFISYFVYEYLLLFVLDLFNISFSSLNYMTRVIILFGIESLFIVTLLLAYKKEIKNDINDFKKNGKGYLKKYVSYYMMGVILMGISNLILQKITSIPISGNEQSVRKLIDVYPIYMTFLSVIYAPIVEEIIFRKSIRNLVKNGTLFIIISGLIFGGVHISDFSDFRQILLGIPYILMGMDFAYIYYKSNNIFTTMIFHAVHNALLLILYLVF